MHGHPGQVVRFTVVLGLLLIPACRGSGKTAMPREERASVGEMARSDLDRGMGLSVNLE